MESLRDKAGRVVATHLRQFDKSDLQGVPDGLWESVQQHMGPASKLEQARWFGNYRSWWWPNGPLWCCESYKSDGIPDGPSIWWYPNGRMWRLEYYSNGLKHGPSSWWHPNGQRSSSALYEHGVEKSYQRWTEAGTPTS